MSALKYLEKHRNLVPESDTVKMTPSRAAKRVAAEEEYIDVETCTEPIAKKKVSQSGLFIPENFVNGVGFDHATGELLTRQEVEANIRKAFKNKRPIDYYSILEESQRDGVKGTPLEVSLKISAYNSIALNEIMRNQKECKSASRLGHVKESGFDVAAARDASEQCELPGGAKLIIGSFLSPNVATHWRETGNDSGIAQCVLNLSEMIAKKDPLYLLYAAPTSSRRTKYVPFPVNYYDSFAKMIQAGFGLPENSATRVIAVIKDVTINFIDRLRADYKECHGDESVEEALKQFRRALNSNAQFRNHETVVGDDLSVGRPIPGTSNFERFSVGFEENEANGIMEEDEIGNVCDGEEEIPQED